MRVALKQTAPALSISTTPIEGDPNPPNSGRSAEQLRAQISAVQQEISGHYQIIAASSKATHKGVPGINIHKLAADGRGPAIAKARQKLEALEKELDILTLDTVS